MRVLIFLTIVSWFLTGCASLADIQAETEAAHKADQMQADAKANEILPAFKQAFVGQEIYLTSKALCQAEIIPFKKAKIQEVDVKIETYSFKDQKWDGSAKIEFSVKQGNTSAKISISADQIESELKSLSPISKYLFDSDEHHNLAIDCFSFKNPITDMHLSKREIAAIQSEKLFEGMRGNAVLMAVGRPEEINRTRVSGHAHDQWVVWQDGRKEYYYLRDNILTGWQTKFVPN